MSVEVPGPGPTKSREYAVPRIHGVVPVKGSVREGSGARLFERTVSGQGFGVSEMAVATLWLAGAASAFTREKCPAERRPDKAP